MSDAKQKTIVIVGPTGSGKTGLSVELARRLDGEVISADSRQVYRGLDIGTEKVSQREMRGVPHHCIDMASPRRAFSVEQWRRHAEGALKNIARRARVPIVAGGTGFYVDALVYGTDFPAVAPNTRLRRELIRLHTDELLLRLRALDPVRAETIEQKNPRRLMRAIEIATALGHVPILSKREPHFDVTWVGLFPGDDVLTERLEARLDRTLRKGLVDETSMLRETLGLSWKRIDELGLEYRIAARYLRGEILKPEMRACMLQELRRYTKRQMTWFKRNKDIVWYTDATDAMRAFEMEA